MKVLFWTVQKLDVVTVLLQQGFYQPAFAYSDYVGENEKLSDLYGFMLNAYNRVNNTEYPGLIFTFLEGGEDGYVYDFKSYELFRDFIRKHSLPIKSLWKNLASKNTVVMCIEREVSDKNLLLIDINDFQYMMPPVLQVPPYSEGFYNFLVQNIAVGNKVQSVNPSGVLQAHIPYIKAEEVVGLYPMFEL